MPDTTFARQYILPGAFDEIKSINPEEASEVMQWFENNYVHGRIRRLMRGGNI